MHRCDDGNLVEGLFDLNATQAAIRAGYSEKTAYSQGQRLLKNVEVAEAIERGQSKTGQRLEITKDRIVEELAKMAFASCSELPRPRNGCRVRPRED